ncbi:hypothetical protein ESY86_19985 [Subsaximicrobium wynnwilliamsii]|uniref:Uncharacterized protein n=1 Tax=Subsaximicrobium wynnwilliamsii TaxID=291179 RepID=A0A5C6ZAB5_9FLAO|nr:hypothetical protein [Subsaximicrobium wynnwilliamsii]TXD80794.1 hypothetical protein ESY87_20155 [Subsaximicrobium wynnwilliamsii]TXD86532.1 hypothetical protein ESY86_19985 [Subsaximicrobium wynnwilliamsii]TXE00088.1 hypothetical protein ESY88_20095 [Subsaximicrobium wynnwilliamsii]
MKHKRIKTYLKFGILLFGISAIAIACQKDDNVSTEQNSELKIPQIETISYDDDNTTFNNLKSQYNLDRYRATKFTGNIQAKSTTDTLGLVIETDIIKQATLGDYTSYTIKIVHQNDSTVFYNLTIEYKNGESDLFITKYTPTEYWINNKDKPFQGKVQSKRATLTQYTDPEEAFEEGYTGNPELGSGPGGGGGAQYGSDYPVGCLGTVVVTTELVAYKCGCGDWPWDDCEGCSTSPQWPGYDQVTLYACEENWDIEDPYDPGDTGNPGGGSLPDPTDDDPSITVTIRPEECTEQITGDLDGDCALSPYEFCMLGDNSQEICDCVADDNTLAECIEEDELISDCNLLENLSLSADFATKMQELINNTTGNTEIAYFGSTDDNDDTTFPDRVESQPDQRGVNVSISSNVPVDVFIHNHFNNGLGSLSVFSGSDLYTLYQLYTNGNISDVDEYVMVVATPGSNASSTDDDTVYAITINDLNSFAEFGSKFLIDDFLIDALYQNIGNKIDTNISINLNEERFAKLLKDFSSGLTLHRGDRNDLTSWTKLKVKNDNTIKESNCN